MPTRGPILILDDDPAFRELVADDLARTGFTSVQAATGEAALAAAGAQRPSLALLDVHLPGMSGYEVCRRLRERFGERFPVIFISGERTEPHDRVAGLLIGADDYVVKPVFPDELAARVRRLIVLTEANGVRDVACKPARGMTKREREILHLLAQGLPQKAIAGELYISPKTVATHIQRILAKLGVHSRAEAIAAAYRLGLVSPDTAAPSAVPPPDKPAA